VTGRRQRESIPTARDAAAAVVRTLRGAGFTAYFAGGCVRDELLGVEPSDYDVATDATPEIIAKLFPRTAEVGAHFGVVLVKMYPHVVEVATFRADGDYTDKRRPDSVRFSSPEEDARRRDFTVNALFLDPLAASPAERVIDFVGGLNDLKSRVLRAVGDPEKRLAEDHLRGLRAARLGAKLGFEIEPGTAGAIRLHARELAGVSRERIHDEVAATLTHPSRMRGAELLRDLGLEAPVLAGLPLSLAGRGPRVLAGIGGAGSNFGVALAAWCLDMGLRAEPGAVDAAADALRRALVLSNEERAEFHASLTGLRVLREGWLAMPVAQAKRFAAGPCWAGGLALARADDANLAARVEARARELEADGVGLAPPPLLTGDHLIAMGHKAGPKFKAVLESVYDAQLEGRVRDLGAARELASSLCV